MRLDIRTYLILLVLSATCASLNTHVLVEIGIILALSFLQLLSGKGVFMPRLLLLYGVLLLIQYQIFPVIPEVVVLLLSLPVVNIRSFFPVIMCVVLIYKTTQVSQVVATFTKMKVSKGATIAIAIAIRYIPSLAEEWRHIKEAMWVRRATVGIHNPIVRLSKCIECYLVPLLISAIKTSDELSAAAITRGIDSPGMPTCRKYRPMGAADYIVILLSIGVTAFCVVNEYILT